MFLGVPGEGVWILPPLNIDWSILSDVGTVESVTCEGVRGADCCCCSCNGISAVP